MEKNNVNEIINALTVAGIEVDKSEKGICVRIMSFAGHDVLAYSVIASAEGITKAIMAVNTDDEVRRIWNKNKEMTLAQVKDLRDSIERAKGKAAKAVAEALNPRAGSARRIRNIVASLVLAQGETTLRDELRMAKLNVRPATEVFRDGRQAMAAVITGDALEDASLIIEHSRALLADFITRTVMRHGRSLRLENCTHEVIADGEAYVETFRNVYLRDEDGSVVTDASDHIPEGKDPIVFYGTDPDDLTFDELAEIATALSNNKYTVIE